MDRPTVYIETSIVSYLASRPSRDPVTLRNQQLTHAWWNTRRHDYALFTSPYVVREASSGNQALAQQRLALLASLPLLSIVPPTRDVARDLMQRVPLPGKAEQDALHIALGAVQRMAYLLTWDGKHIANRRLRHRIERVCASWGLPVPILCTPATLLGD